MRARSSPRRETSAVTDSWSVGVWMRRAGKDSSRVEGTPQELRRQDRAHVAHRGPREPGTERREEPATEHEPYDDARGGEGGLFLHHARHVGLELRRRVADRPDDLADRGGVDGSGRRHANERATFAIR